MSFWNEIESGAGCSPLAFKASLPVMCVRDRPVTEYGYESDCYGNAPKEIPQHTSAWIFFNPTNFN